MNFFDQQEKARKNTRILILLFMAAIVVLILLTNAFLIFFPWEMNSRAFSEGGSNRSLVCLMQSGCEVLSTLNWRRIIIVSLFVPLAVSVVSLWKWLAIRKGGKSIAKLMGGTLLSSNTKDIQEKRLLNVVEEMALAAGMAVPAIYVMQEEAGVNAFAAGFTQKDAVIAVTSGTLQSLNRDQLQGVIAHEFSHILNGDMRLNMHLIAVLHGIMFITEAGMVFLRGGRHSRRNSRDPTMALGLGLVVLGATGTFFGEMIKAAVSRQREFLADASAVQFTRNPEGIANALKIIGGAHEESFIQEGHKTEVSHLFFARCSSWRQSLFATHPPLGDRISRIQPRWDGEYFAPGYSGQFTVKQEGNSAESGQKNVQNNLSTMMAAVMASSIMPAENTDIAAIPLNELHEPLGAAAAICCLLLPECKTEQTACLNTLRKQWPQLCVAIEESSWAQSQREDFLDVFDIGVSALRLLSEEEYRRLKQCLMSLIKHDGDIHLYEWALYYSLRGHLDCHFQQEAPTSYRYKTVACVADDMNVIIARLITETEQDEPSKLKAYARALNTCGIYQLSDDCLPEVTQFDFMRAMKKLGQAYPLIKSRFIKALIDAATADGHIEAIEQQTIVAIAMTIDSSLSSIGRQQLGLVA